MTTKKTVYLDCTEMKFPNTGLYHFCLNLGNALLNACDDNGIRLVFCLPEEAEGIFGQGAEQVIFRKSDKKLFPYWRFRGGIWHVPFQFPKIYPAFKTKVQTIHDLNFLYEEPEDRQKMFLRDMQELVDKAERIVTISEYSRQDIFRHLDTGKKRVDVIYNGCNIYEGPLERPEYVPEMPFLYSVGTLMEKKNFHVLPCLLKGNSYEMVISGLRFPYEKQIMESAAACGVTDRVHLTGPVPESHKWWYMRHCLAFMFPSIAEGFGLPALEAMSCGKPVFLSRHTSLPEIGGNKAFYFNYGFEPEQMRKEFREGMEKYESGAVTPEEIMRHALSFSWENAAMQYINIYRSLQ